MELTWLCASPDRLSISTRALCRMQSLPHPSCMGHLIPAASRAQATLDPSTYLEWDLENLPPGNDYAPTPRHYNTSGGPKEAMLNIHFISHSHVRYTCVMVTPCAVLWCCEIIVEAAAV